MKQARRNSQMAVTDRAALAAALAKQKSDVLLLAQKHGEAQDKAKGAPKWSPAPSPTTQAPATAAAAAPTHAAATPAAAGIDPTVLVAAESSGARAAAGCGRSSRQPTLPGGRRLPRHGCR